jgi:hypothetical protein
VPYLLATGNTSDSAFFAFASQHPIAPKECAKTCLCIVLVTARQTVKLHAFRKLQTQPHTHIAGHKFARHTASEPPLCVNCCVFATFFKKLPKRLLAAGASDRGFFEGEKPENVNLKETKCSFIEV